MTVEKQHKLGGFPLLICVIMSLFVAMYASGTAVAATKNPIPDGWYMMVSGSSDNRVLDIHNWSQDNGGNLEIYQKNNTTNQRFYLKYRDNGYYTISVLHSGKYLHKANSGKSDDVHQWDGYGADNTYWAVEDAGNGYYYLRNKCGKYLDNSGGKTNLGNNVIMWDFHGGTNQQWKFLSTSDGLDEICTISDGWYIIESGNSSNRVLDINNWSQNNGGNLEIYQNNKTTNQLFFVQYRDNGYYSIRAFHSNKYLHKANSGYVDDVHQWDGYGADNTQWALYPSFDGDYYYIRSKSGNYLDNSGGRTDLGNNVITYNFNGSNAQKWKFNWVGWGLLGYEQIDSAAKQLKIKNNSEDAYKALDSINNYSLRLSENDKKNPLVFLFEGVGASRSLNLENKRMNAICVVVKGNKIVYTNKYCSTIPDNPFKPSLNEGKDVPTLISGIYSYSTTNHLTGWTKGRNIPFAALHIIEENNKSVLRHSNSSNYYRDSSGSINVHARGSKWTSTSKNSTGCMNVGDIFNDYPNEYAGFLKAVGVVSGNATVTTKTESAYWPKGKIVIDRTFARPYLESVGYEKGAIDIIING